MLAEMMKLQATKPVFLDVLNLAICERASGHWRTITVSAKDAADFVAQLALMDCKEELAAVYAAKVDGREHKKYSRPRGAYREKQVVSLKDGDHQW